MTQRVFISHLTCEAWKREARCECLLPKLLLVCRSECFIAFSISQERLNPSGSVSKLRAWIEMPLPLPRNLWVVRDQS